MQVDRLATHPAVTALHLGVGDLAASLGARSAEVGASPADYRHATRTADGLSSISLDFFAYPMMRLLVTARASGRLAIDGPCGAFTDTDLTASSAMKAAAMGFDGKQVIHPSQIEATNTAFTPAEAEVADARAMLAAFAEATAEGRGAVTFKGRMIDKGTSAWPGAFSRSRVKTQRHKNPGEVDAMTTSVTGEAPQYEVYAIKYAELKGRHPGEIFLGADPHEAAVDMDYFIWLIRSAERNIVVDMGFNREIAARRGRHFLRCPTEGLAALGVDARTVTDVVISHMHYDHVGNYELFPASRSTSRIAR